MKISAGREVKEICLVASQGGKELNNVMDFYPEVVK